MARICAGSRLRLFLFQWFVFGVHHIVLVLSLHVWKQRLQLSTALRRGGQRRTPTKGPAPGMQRPTPGAASAKPRSSGGDTLDQNSLWELPLDDKSEVLSRMDAAQFNEHILGQMNNDDCTVARPIPCVPGFYSLKLLRPYL